MQRQDCSLNILRILYWKSLMKSNCYRLRTFKLVYRNVHFIEYQKRLLASELVTHQIKRSMIF